MNRLILTLLLIAGTAFVAVQANASVATVFDNGLTTVAVDDSQSSGLDWEPSYIESAALYFSVSAFVSSSISQRTSSVYFSFPENAHAPRAPPLH